MSEHKATGCAAWFILFAYTAVAMGVGFLIGAWWA
jgi:hypothetical protein